MRSTSCVSIILLLASSIISALIVPSNSTHLVTLPSEPHQRGSSTDENSIHARAHSQLTEAQAAARRAAQAIVVDAVNKTAAVMQYEFKTSEKEVLERQILNRVVFRTTIRFQQLIFILVYLERLEGKVPSYSNTNLGGVYNTLCALILLAHKMTNDKTYNNYGWAAIIGSPPGGIFAFERRLLELLDYRLTVKPDEYSRAAKPFGISNQVPQNTKAEEESIVQEVAQDITSTQPQAGKPTQTTAVSRRPVPAQSEGGCCGVM